MENKCNRLYAEIAFIEMHIHQWRFNGNMTELKLLFYAHCRERKLQSDRMIAIQCTDYFMSAEFVKFVCAFEQLHCLV